MKKLTLILLLAIAKISLAQINNSQQDTTLVYSSPMYAKDPVRSKWRPVVKSVGEFYQVTFYDRKNVIQEVISFEDKNLTVRKGPYIGYQKGKLREKGNYNKGYEHGDWISYSNNGDQILKKETFVFGKLYGKYIEYWDNNNNNNTKEEGVYENGRKIGEWNLYYNNSKPAGKEMYDAYGKKIEGLYFLRDGQPAKYEDLFSSPSYKGGIIAFYKFLGKEMQYPTQSAREKVQGTVKLSFTIKKNGKIEDIKVIETPNKELADEAIRATEMAPDWSPGKMLGEATDNKYSVPIKFSL